MTQRETIQLLMKALGETIPEHGCRHDYRIDWLRCNRCQALFAGQAVLDESVEAPSSSYSTHIFGAQDYKFMPCCEPGCPNNATFVTFVRGTVDSIVYYCEDHGMRRGLQRGIPTDDKSKTYDDYSKSRNRVLGNKS